MNILAMLNSAEMSDYEETIKLLVEEGTCKTEKAAWKYIQKIHATAEYQAKLLLHINQGETNEST